MGFPIMHQNLVLVFKLLIVVIGIEQLLMIVQ